MRPPAFPTKPTLGKPNSFPIPDAESGVTGWMEVDMPMKRRLPLGSFGRLSKFRPTQYAF